MDPLVEHGRGRPGNRPSPPDRPASASIGLVMVYRIIPRGTIEEEILKLHAGKRDLVAGVMEGTEAAGRLSTDELISLIREHAAD